MKNVLILFVILKLILPSLEALGQNAPSFNMIGPSPNAASLAQYAQTPVDLASGVPQISVPLMELQAQTLSLPVSLNYHAQGRQVEERASWVGLGWSLDAGGVITRKINGFHDDCPTVQMAFDQELISQAQFGDLSFWPNTGGFFFNRNLLTAPLQNPSLVGEEMEQGVLDLRPDEFMFNFFGHVGTFMMGVDGDFQTFPEEDLIIEWDPTGTNFFTITDDYGYIFQFESIERTSLEYDCEGSSNFAFPVVNENFVTSWFLTRVLNNNGQVEFEFEYLQNPNLISLPSSSETVALNAHFQKIDTPIQVSGIEIVTQERMPLVVDNAVHKTCIVLQKTHNLMLERITSIGGSIEFSAMNWRMDIPFDKSLNRISYYNSIGTHVVSYRLNSDYGGVNATAPRLRLQSLSKSFNLADWEDISTFEYNNIELPDYSSNAVDHWGFYNGKHSNINKIIPFDSPYSEYQSYVNRDSDENFMKAGILSSILYQGGRSTQFEYEINKLIPLNTSFDFSYKRQESSSNLQDYYLEEEIPDSYIYENGESVGDGLKRMIPREFFTEGMTQYRVNARIIPTDNYDQMCGEINSMDDNFTIYFCAPHRDLNGDLLYSEVVNSVPYILDISDLLNGSGGWVEVYNGFLPQDTPYSVGFLVYSGYEYCYNIEVDVIKETITMQPVVFQENVGAGLRVSKVIDSPGVGEISITSYEYPEDAVLLAQPRYVMLQTSHRVFYEYNCGSSTVGITSYGSIGHSNSVSELERSNGGFALYKNVIVKKKDEQENVHSYDQYYFDVSVPIESPSIPFISNNYKSWKGSRIIKKEIRSADGSEILLSTEYLYEDIPSTHGVVKGIEQAYSHFVHESRYVENVPEVFMPCKDEFILISKDRQFKNVIRESYRSRLIKTITVDRTNIESTGEGIVESFSYFDSNQHQKPTRTRTVFANLAANDPEREVWTRIMYTGDFFPGLNPIDPPIFATNEKGNYARCIWNLKARNVKSMPIVQYQLRGADEANLRVVSGSLSTYNFSSLNKISFHSSFILDLPTPIALENVQVGLTFINGWQLHIPSQFTRIGKVLEYDSEANVISQLKEHDIVHSVIRAYPERRIIAEVMNATSDRCAYTSFESPDQGGWTYTQPISNSDDYTNNSLGVAFAKTGLLAISKPHGALIASKALPHGEYVLTFWSKSGLPSVFIGTMSLNQSSATNLVRGGWEYHEVRFEITANSATLNLVNIHSSQNCILDELRVHPVGALMSSVSFDSRGRVITTCDGNNQCFYYVYDSADRLAYTADEYFDVTTRTEYNIASISNPNDITNIWSYSANEGNLTIADFENQNSNQDYLNKGVTYYDGFSRPLQTIAVDAAPFGHRDLINFHEYDSRGIERLNYLPYVDQHNAGTFEENPIDECKAFYETAAHIKHTDFPWSEKVVENSSLRRTLEAGAAGEDWQLGNGHTSKSTTHFNSSDEVLKWEWHVGYAAASVGMTPIYWPENSLVKTESEDANGQKTWTYTDQKGRTILTRIAVESYGIGYFVPVTFDNSLGTDPPTNFGGTTPRNLDTYYVYDEFGQLFMEIPPVVNYRLSLLGTLFLGTHPGDVNYDLFNEYVYGYSYDNRGRLALKKSPGQGWDLFVYNNLNQIIMSQNPIQALTHQWSFVKYDGLGREIMTGITRSNFSRLEIQNSVDLMIDHLWEERSTEQGNVFGYTFTSFPYDYDEILTVNYYDDYDFQFNGMAYSGNEPLSARTLGYSTGSKVKVLDSNPEQYLTSVTYYNNDGRAIETWSETLRGGHQKSNLEYDWKGQTTRVASSIQLGSDNTPVLFENTFTYDKAGRLLQTYQKTGANDQPVLISELEYNLLGQVVKKNLHKPMGYSGFMQTVDYRYNELGWLSKINNAELAADGDNLEDYDIFGEELIYTGSEMLDDNVDEIASSGMMLSPQYNGSISMMEWKVKDPDVPQNQDGYHAYIMRYDELGQLTNAAYAKSDVYGKLTQDHNVWMEKATYSIAGNITNLTRNRPNEDPGSNAPYLTADELVYEYGDGNRLKSVYDGGSNTTNEAYKHFIDVDNGVNADYTYDPMGRMLNDFNKGFTYSYNILGQVKSVDNGLGNPDCEFTYDAAGNKLMKKVGNKITYYIGSVEFEGNGTLISVPTPEGIARRRRFIELDNQEYAYDYYLTDHLGNVRAIITNENSQDIVDVASMEPNVLQGELEVFENLTGPIDTTPDDWAAMDALNTQVALLSSAGYVVGPSFINKMNTGDKVAVSVESYYESQQTPDNSGQTLTQIFAGMLVNISIQGQGILPPGEQGIGAFSNASSAPSTSLSNFLNSHISELDSNSPQSFLVYVFFNNRLTVVPAYSGVVQVGDPDIVSKLEMTQKTLPVDGYFFTYVTNHSTRGVYFNNLTITRKEGVIRKINDYYPFGLTWQNLPAEELRNIGYQGKDWQGGEWDNASLDLYDFHARMYDPVIGRWLVPDPAAQHFSLYLAMGNNPVSNTDPNGLWTDDYYYNLDGSFDRKVDTSYPDQIYAQSRDGLQHVGGYDWSGNFNWTDDFAPVSGAPFFAGMYGDFSQRRNQDVATGVLDAMSSFNLVNASQGAFALAAGAVESTIDGASMLLSGIYQSGDGARYGFIDLTKGTRAAQSAFAEMDHRLVRFSRYEGFYGKDFDATTNMSPRDGASLMGGVTSAIGIGYGAASMRSAMAGSSGAVKEGTQGGLNLYKWGAEQTGKSTGWKAGDYMLHLPNKGTPALNWKANYGALRSEMNLGKPIFDSYRLPNGNLIPTGGFLNAERSILQGRGWLYNSGSGAWMPPGF